MTDPDGGKLELVTGSIFNIEHDILDNIIPLKRGMSLTIHGVEGWVRIDLGKPKEVNLNDERIEVERIVVLIHTTQKLEETPPWIIIDEK